MTKFLNVAGGVTADQALANATSNLEAVRETMIDLIDQSMRRLAVLQDQTCGAPSDKARAALHAESTKIQSVAGTFGLAPMGVAAKLLCDYLDLLAARGAWDPQGVRLHHDAMRCLRTENGSDDCQQILEGLKRLSLRQPAEGARALRTASP